MVYGREIINLVVLLSLLQFVAVSPAVGYVVQPRSSLNLRAACQPTSPPPSTQVNTTGILEELRNEMRKRSYQAFVITSTNEHQSEDNPHHDLRREYVSGFTGSSGDAVVTLTRAALWTDSRYYLQADSQLDCNWELIKEGEMGSPTIIQWLAEEFKSGGTIAADSKILTYREWSEWVKYLSDVTSPAILVESDTNLVDIIWTTEEGRPPYVTAEAFVHPIDYAGETWERKMVRVRTAMKELMCDGFVVTALDEIAWLLNLRGTDIPYTPFFLAYLVIEARAATVYLPTEKQTTDILKHLNHDGVDSLTSVRVKDYDQFWADLQGLEVRVTKVLLPDEYSYAMAVSYKIYNALNKDPGNKATMGVSPILKMRDYKSDHEAIGMRNAHIRDAVALCQFLHRIERDILSGEETWDELKAVALIDELRSKQNESQGPSFGTTSAFGPNSALPHYEPTEVTNLVIDKSSLYMLDSGGQYFDGTTDVTRTLHYGVPTDLQKEAYTRLLIGCIQLASVKFPTGKTLQNLEILIRAPLYGLGLDYGHGSTHGIGFYGGVHEAFNSTYHINFFGSQEPGYYTDNSDNSKNFGMRLENIVTVVDANIALSGNTTFLAFNTVTLVPYDRKLIKEEMLSADEIKWLNDYYSEIRLKVGEEMLRQNLLETYDWLLLNTEPFGLVTAGVSVTGVKVWQFCITMAIITLKVF